MVRLFVAGCVGEIIVSSREVVLKSPNFPNYYPPNLRYSYGQFLFVIVLITVIMVSVLCRCKWTLVGRFCCGFIRIKFTHIILEERYDMVKVCLKDVCKEDEKIILTGNTV